MQFKFSCISISTFVILVAASLYAAQQMTIVPDKSNGVYQVGDTVHWTVGWKGTNVPVAHYTFKSGGLTDVGQGDLNFSNGIASLETKFDAPGTMLVEVKWQPENDTNRSVGGAVAAPERIKPAASPPADFDVFWKAKIEELNRVSINQELEKVDSGKPGVEYWKVTLGNIRGTHVYGQIARPAEGKKFPALLILQWANVYPLQKNWVTDRAADGWLALDIEPHDLPIDKPESFYKELQANGPLHDYWTIGNDDRDTSYFLRMYLSCYRAVEYLKMRPDWDGKTLVVMGDSQGGGQALMVAGLHPEDITAVLALVPSGCDMLGPEAGHAPDFTQWYFRTEEGKDPQKVREASRYYDTANFARHIQCPVLVGTGLRDEVNPPAGVFAAVNQITSPKELIILSKSGHQNVNGSQASYDKRRWEAWLPALRKGLVPPLQP
jgi:cephalosporin-C deacetylase